MRKSEIDRIARRVDAPRLQSDVERRIWQIYARIVGGRICADLSESALCKAAFHAARRAVAEYDKLLDAARAEEATNAKGGE